MVFGSHYLQISVLQKPIFLLGRSSEAIISRFRYCKSQFFYTVDLQKPLFQGASTKPILIKQPVVNPQRIKRPMKSSDLFLLQINYYKFEIKILKVRIPFGVNWDDLGIDLRDLGIRFCCFDDFVALIAKPNIYLI